jgi:hypothetical protein
LFAGNDMLPVGAHKFGGQDVLDIELNFGRGRTLQLSNGEPWRLIFGNALVHEGVFVLGFGPFRAVFSWPPRAARSAIVTPSPWGCAL